jgi:SAM-dependent methyltransferase
MRHPMRTAPVRRLSWALALAPLLAWGHSGALPPASAQAVKEKKPDVIFVPTPQEVVDKMLELAEVKKEDVLYDLGCGDGRIVATAAKRHGVKAVGIDIDPQRIAESRETVRKAGVDNLVTIKQADIFEEELGEASVVTLYLLPELNVRLMPRLKRLKPGTRIVSHDFDMKGAKPKKVVSVRTDDDEEEHTVYLWVVPWEDEKP